MYKIHTRPKYYIKNKTHVRNLWTLRSIDFYVEMKFRIKTSIVMFDVRMA